MITNIKDQLTRDEGHSLVAYPDQFGNPTIGIGHELTKDEHYPQGISSDQCDQLFAMDLMIVENSLRKWLPWASMLDDARLGILKNMCFEMGISRLLGFKNMLAALQEHDFMGAAREMIDSKWATQVPDRARRLEMQMESGEWQ